MNDEFNNNNELQIHLEEYARRLNTAISRMRAHSYRVNFVVDNSIAAEIQELADLERLCISSRGMSFNIGNSAPSLDNNCSYSLATRLLAGPALSVSPITSGKGTRLAKVSA